MAIRACIDEEETRNKIASIEDEDTDDESYSTKEGTILLKLHKYRERNRQLVKKKKDLVLKKVGYLACEVYMFRFDLTYGELGTGYIECHHTSSIYLVKPGTYTYLSDLALVCANCHRMLHCDLTMSLANLRSKLKLPLQSEM